MRKKVQVNESGCKYILFRIHVYFSEYLIAVKIDEKGQIDRDLIFGEKGQEALEKSLVVNLLELIQVNVMMKVMKLVEYKHLLV